MLSVGGYSTLNSKFSISESDYSNHQGVIQLFITSLRDSFADKDFETIYKRSRQLVDTLKEIVNKKRENFGIIIETLEIEYVQK